jgi:hypothetical protein
VYSKGSKIYEENEKANKIYFIYQGEVEFTKRMRNIKNINSGLELYDSGPLEKKKVKLEIKKLN